MLDKFKESFIKTLVELREKRGLTQAQMAEAIGIAHTTYQKYEYGKAFPRPDKVALIAAALGVEDSDLFRSSNEQSSDYKNSNPSLSKSELIGIAVSMLSSFDEEKLRSLIRIMQGYASDSNRSIDTKKIGS